MTPERCEEMRKYRREAVLVETQLRARARKKLLAKVQSVVDEIEVICNISDHLIF